LLVVLFSFVIGYQELLWIKNRSLDKP